MEQVGQSPMIGEVLAGILLGPMVLGVIDPNPALQPGASLSVVSTLGILVLVLLAGMELGREGLRQAIRERSILVAIVEFALPFALGYSLAAALGMDFPQSLFLGTALAVTALPISVRILMDLNLLHSRVGRAIVSVALANDLVAFAMLGLVLEIVRVGATTLDPWVLGWAIVKNVLFLGLVLCVSAALKALMRARPSGLTHFQALLERLKGTERGMATSIIIALFLGAAAEAVGIHFAIGVFYGGVLITPRLLGEARFVKVRSGLQTVTFGLLSPIFFGFVGLTFSIAFGSWPLIALILAVAFFGKFFGGILGGLFAGFRGRSLVALGIGLNARGMMELLLAQVGLTTGIITVELYSALVVTTLVTTLCTPPLMKRTMRGFRTEDILPVVPRKAEEPGG
jgi:Kef-type K+ transport system membrane component KefB